MMNTPTESEAEPRVSDTSDDDRWTSHTSTKVLYTRSTEGDIKDEKINAMNVCLKEKRDGPTKGMKRRKRSLVSGSVMELPP